MFISFSFLFLLVYFSFVFLFFFVFFSKSLMVELYLFSCYSFDISFSFIFDFLSLGFFSSVSFISFVVFVYSNFYMSGTVDNRRFLYLTFLFVMSMFLLVFSGNFFVTMVGWDGLGLVSFCLVVFYSNSSSLESGLITVFSNRLGDVFFLVCFYIFFLSGVSSWDVFCVYNSLLFSLFFFLGAITKSAQIPFSAWLPAAMAAPTPVSSLVHSSTLVTAGVYVLIRFNYIFSFLNFSILKVFFIFTMVMAGFSAVLESDLKKIVAMSTLSQLGMMMFILSVGGWLLSFLHMIIHAFFKSMLFLSTGSLMSQLAGGQDARFFGGSTFSFGSFLFFCVSCLCLAGFPFFLGFYSKDFILSSCSYTEGTFYVFVFFVGCIFTVMYSLRLIYSGYFVGYKYINHMSFSEDAKFLFPVLLLFFKCWIFGGLIFWLFLSELSLFFFCFDVLTGCLIMLIAFFMYLVLKISFRVFFSLAAILFLRWEFSSGTSVYFNSFLFCKHEGSWMELAGGSGVYSYLSSRSVISNSFSFMSLGMILFFCIVSTVYFF